MNKKIRPPKEKLEQIYKELSVMDTCLELDVTPITLYKWLKEAGIEKKGHPQTIVSPEEKIAFIKGFQKEHGYPPSANEIALALKIAPQTVKQWLVKMAIAGKIEKGEFYYPVKVTKTINFYRSYKII